MHIIVDGEIVESIVNNRTYLPTPSNVTSCVILEIQIGWSPHSQNDI